MKSFRSSLPPTALSKRLARHKLSILTAIFMSLLLGFISSLLFALVGPAIEILTQINSARPLAMEELVGVRFALFFKNFGIASVTPNQVWHDLACFIFFLAFVRAILLQGQWYIWEGVGEGIGLQLRSEIVKKFLQQPTKCHHRQQTDATLSSLLTNDVRLSREYVVHFCGGLPRELLQIMFYVISLIMISPGMFLIFLFGVLPAGLFLAKMGKKLRKRAKAVLENHASLVEWLQQRFIGVETIKHFCGEAKEAEAFAEKSLSLYRKSLNAVRVKAKTSPILETVAVLAMVVVLQRSLNAVVSGSSSGSVQFSFFATIAVLSQSMAKAGRYFNANREGGAAYLRVGAYLGGKWDQDSDMPALFSSSEDCVRMENISVRYPGANEIVLQDLSLTLKKGRLYGIIGASGSGKSTIIKTLLGCTDIIEGSLRWSSLCKDNQSLALVPQTLKLAPLSIAGNIAYPESEWDENNVNASLRAVQADFVFQLPQSIDTKVGEGGLSLSGGQVQRIFLARLLYLSAALVLIDEGTSALDPSLEQMAASLFKSLALKGSTVVWVTHKKIGLELADQVLTVNQGRIQPA